MAGASRLARCRPAVPILPSRCVACVQRCRCVAATVLRVAVQLLAARAESSCGRIRGRRAGPRPRRGAARRAGRPASQRGTGARLDHRARPGRRRARHRLAEGGAQRRAAHRGRWHPRAPALSERPRRGAPAGRGQGAAAGVPPAVRGVATARAGAAGQGERRGRGTTAQPLLAGAGDERRPGRGPGRRPGRARPAGPRAPAPRGRELVLDLTSPDAAVAQLAIQSGDQIFVGRRRDTMRDVVLPLSSIVGAAASITSLLVRR